MMGGIHVLLVFSVISLAGAEVQIPVQVVPQGIESRNGSDVNMGCASPPAGIGDVMLCGTPLADVDNGTCGNYNGSESYMVDCNSPAIDTSTSNWASQLVTARKNKKNDDTNFDHVVLTFYFDTAVSPTAIELDLFLCPEWNIGAPYISVYAEESKNTCGLVFSDSSVETGDIDFLIHYTPKGTSCDSLTNVSIPVQEPIGDKSYFTWHIVVSFGPQPDIEWVYVGEVRFVDVPAVCSNSSASVEIPGPSSTDMPTSITPPTTTATATTNATTAINSSTNTTTTTTATAATTATTSINSKSTTLGMPSTTIVHMKTTLIGSLPLSTTLTPMGSSTTPIGLPSPNPTQNDSMAAPLIALVPGNIAFVLLVVIVVIVIGFFFIRRRNRSQTLHDLLKGHHELKPQCYSGGRVGVANPNVYGSDIGTPAHSGADNPEAPVIDSVYDVVTDTMTTPMTTPITGGIYDEVDMDVDDTYTPMNGCPKDNVKRETSTQKATFNENVDEEMGLYEVIPLVVTTTKASADGLPVYMCIQEETQPSTILKSSDLSTNDTTSKNEAVSDPPIYSGVQKKRKAPLVPRKSADLEQYLAICPAFNEGVYSECINQSDFTCNFSQESEEIEEKETDLQVYAPIYTVPASLPEGIERPVEITSDNIQEVKELGTGQFGQVVLAATNGLSLKDMQLSKTDDNQDTSIHVAVKKLKPNPSQVQQEAFDMEIKLMSRLRHPNVGSFLGVCYRDPAFIVMEYMEGDLSQFLQQYSEIVPITSPSNTYITTSTVVHMAAQIASAMQYLASFNYVHRDLATRKCLVGTNFTVKVADLGVNTNFYRSHYYRVKDNMLLPIRWMATECFDGKFSEKSDVWAFGITMWELFTLSKEKPYPNLSDEEVIHNALIREYRQFPSKSMACPQPVYEIMEKCWVVDLKQRATFQELHEMLLKNC